MDIMYLALDIETTGLDPLNDRILEVGWTWLTDDLRQTTPIKSRVVTPSVATHDILRAVDPIVLDMHSKTGLLKALDEEGTLMLGDVEDLILYDIRNDLDKRSEVILFGMGPHFDHAFINTYMPRLSLRLHYRHYDVRTLTQFFSNLGIEHGVVNLSKHRAGPDVRESIEIAQYYRGMLAEGMPY